MNWKKKHKVKVERTDPSVIDHFRLLTNPNCSKSKSGVYLKTKYFTPEVVSQFVGYFVKCKYGSRTIMRLLIETTPDA